MFGPALPSFPLSSGGGGAPAGFAWAPDDWAAAGDAGVGTGTAFDAPTDLNTLDAGTALASSARETDDTVLVAVPTPGTATFAGLKLANVPAGNFGAVVRVSVEASGVNAAGTLAYVAAVGVHGAADLSGRMVAGGVERVTDMGGGNYLRVWRDGGAGGRATDSIRTTEADGIKLAGSFDVLVVRSATKHTFWTRNGGPGSGWVENGADDPGAGADVAGVLSVLTRCGAAPVAVKVRVRVLRGPDAAITGPSDLQS